MRTKFKKVIIFILILILLGCISCGIYFLFKNFNITNIKTLRNFISKFGTWSWIIFILLQVVISTVIFVVPFEDELWVSLSIILFGAKIGFVLSSIAIIIISAVLYFFGNKFGISLAKKFIDEETLVNVQQKLEIKGKLSLPFIYLIPFLPHDALCVVAGMTKMNFWYFLIITILIRPLEIIGVCFLGGGFIDWSTLSVFDWCVLANLVLIDFYLLKKLSRFMEKKLEQKRENIKNNNKKY